MPVLSLPRCLLQAGCLDGFLLVFLHNTYLVHMVFISIFDSVSDDLVASMVKQYFHI